MVNKKYKLVVFRTDGEYISPEKFNADSIDGIINKLYRLSKSLWILYPIHAVVDTITNMVVDLTDDSGSDISLDNNIKTVDDYSKWLKENGSTLPNILL